MTNVKTPKPSHPPIPPNCEYFGVNDAFGMCFVYQTRTPDLCTHWWPLDWELCDLRNVIAAVARCAWMDEGSRIANLSDVEQSKIVAWHKEIQVCELHAEAWRIWGSQ